MAFMGRLKNITFKFWLRHDFHNSYVSTAYKAPELS